MTPEPMTLTGRHVILEPLSLVHLDGLISIGLAVLAVRWHMFHLETRVTRGVFWRRAAAAILMFLGISAFLLARKWGV